MVRVPTVPDDFDLIRRIPYPTLAVFLPVPENVRKGMRTIDPIALSDEERGTAAAEMLRRSVSVIQEIERAAQELADPNTKETCLAFLEAENELTGSTGLLVCRRFADGSYSRPLAELLTSGCDSPEARENGNLLGRTAGEGRFVLVAYKPQDDSPQRVVFACVGLEPDGTNVRWSCLARLLVTPFEIAQWSDPTVRGPKRISH